MSIYLDQNSIVSVGEWAMQNAAQEALQKQYTRSFHGYPLTAYDHSILLVTKKWVQQQQWKDIWAGQNVVKHHPYATTLASLDMHLGMARLGFDILYKYDEETWSCHNIAKPDETVQTYIAKTFGSSGQALVMPSYDACLTDPHIISYLFGIALAHGKWTIKNDVLMPLKITIPCTSSLMGREEFLQKMTQILHALWVIHSVQQVAWSSYTVYQIVIHDPYVLSCYKKWLAPLVKINKISTYESTQAQYAQCLEYLTHQGLQIPWEVTENTICILPCD